MYKPTNKCDVIPLNNISTHSTHKLQPMDVSVFGPFKTYLSNSTGFLGQNTSLLSNENYRQHWFSKKHINESRC